MLCRQVGLPPVPGVVVLHPILANRGVARIRSRAPSRGVPPDCGRWANTDEDEGMVLPDSRIYGKVDRGPSGRERGHVDKNKASTITSALIEAAIAAPAVALSTIAAAKFMEEYVDRGGALSSHAASAYYTVPVEGHRRVAARYSLGGDKYGHNNWKNGDWTFILERLAHMEEHLLRLKEGGNVEDDNLGAILWGGYCLAWYEKHKPEEWRAAMDAIQGRTKFHITTKQKEGKQP